MVGVSVRETIASIRGHTLASYRARTHDLFHPGADEDDTWGRVLDWFVMSLITANVAAVMLATVDPLQARYGRVFRLFELLSVAIFSVEYLARVWSGVEAHDEWHPIYDRIAVVRRPLMVIDLLAIVPFYLAVAGFGLDLRFLRALRLIRFLRLLKLVRYSESMRAFGSAFRTKKDELIVAMTANALLLMVASSLMYFVEHPAQPERFGSIPETMWWGVITLTTVGYGDVAPITPLGRVVGSIVAILGIGLFALPASIMASGFIEESAYETKVCPDCGHEINWEDDVGDATSQYDVGDHVRIDLTAESDLDYRFHGRHGRIVGVATAATAESPHDDDTDRYVIELDGTDATIEADWRELRTPIRRTTPEETVPVGDQ